LCLGYPTHYLDRPLLEMVGWRPRLPLEQLLHFDGWEDTDSQQEQWQGFREAVQSDPSGIPEKN
jgi:5,6-dimethylbenzimidazole synthase